MSNVKIISTRVYEDELSMMSMDYIEDVFILLKRCHRTKVPSLSLWDNILGTLICSVLLLAFYLDSCLLFQTDQSNASLWTKPSLYSCAVAERNKSTIVPRLFAPKFNSIEVLGFLIHSCIVLSVFTIYKLTISVCLTNKITALW